VEWGSAPVLIQSTNKPGKITVTARSFFPGTYAPTPDTITIESVPAEFPMCYSDKPSTSAAVNAANVAGSQTAMSEAERQRILEQVNQQQQDFGVQ
jgi:beta-galactosidase